MLSLLAQIRDLYSKVAAIGSSGSGGASDVYQVQTTTSTPFCDYVLTAVRTLTAPTLVNASGFQVQVLHTDAATAWGPIRTIVADVNSDITAAFSTAAPHVILRFSAVRIDTTRSGYLLFTLN